MAHYWKKQASVAYGYSLTRLALNAYMFFEDLPATYGRHRKNQKQMDDTLMDFLSRLPDGRLSVQEAGNLRRTIKEVMEDVIAFTDRFRIYEYALNRVERRFQTIVEPPSFTEDELVTRIMEYLTSAGGAAEMNRRIQDVIAQLPVRFTRQKFYGMVREALSAYIGSDKESLEAMMYVLRTSGMAELSDKQRSGYPELTERLKEVQELQFKELTADTFQEAQDKVYEVSGWLLNASGYLHLAAEMVNDMYVISLTREDAMRDTSEEAHAWKILTGLCGLYRDGKREIPKQLEAELYFLEGLQENYYEKYQQMDPAPEYRDGEDETAGKSRTVERLLATSMFAVLDGEEGWGIGATGQTVSSKDVDAAVDGLISRLEPVFASCQKPIMRAIMATILSSLPLCFNSLDEIRDYIKNSLGSCGDRVEKEASMELLQQLMESGDYALV